MGKRTTITTFLLATFVTAGLLSPNIADAKWRRKSAHSCTTVDTIQPWRGITNPGGSDVDLYCEIDDDGYFHKGEIDGINVHGFDANTYGGARARVCYSAYNAYSSGCGSFSYSSYGDMGMYTLTPDTSLLSSPSVGGHFTYLMVTLDGGSNWGGRYTTLSGYYLYG